MYHNTTAMMRLVNRGMRQFGIALHGEGKTLGEARSNIAQGYGFPQILYMPCGVKERFDSIHEVPMSNMPCPCGDPNHWVVKYDIPKISWRERVTDFFRHIFKRG